jgi:hypothetical protein
MLVVLLNHFQRFQRPETDTRSHPLDQITSRILKKTPTQNTIHQVLAPTRINLILRLHAVPYEVLSLPVDMRKQASADFGFFDLFVPFFCVFFAALAAANALFRHIEAK